MSTPAVITNILAKQAQLKGKVPYSETDSRRLNSTAAYELTPTDCSGMAHRMYMRYGKIDIGTYTGNEITHGSLVTQDKAAAAAGHLMLPGDLIFFAFYGDRISHVAIYAGNGRIWNHGGPGHGPLDWSLHDQVMSPNCHRVEVRRIIPQTVTPPKPPAPKPGSNPMHGHAVPALISRGTGDYYGDVHGPNESHGGAYLTERPNIELIQKFLNWKYKLNIKVDGIFGASTIAGVKKFQAEYFPGSHYPGQVWYAHWAKMASL